MNGAPLPWQFLPDSTNPVEQLQRIQENFEALSTRLGRIQILGQFAVAIPAISADSNASVDTVIPGLANFATWSVAGLPNDADLINVGYGAPAADTLRLYFRNVSTSTNHPSGFNFIFHIIAGG